MTTIVEGDLTFDFPCNSEAGKYDEWAFYRNQFQPIANGSKAVDILCVEDDSAWLIEIKDYRNHPRTRVIDLADEVAIKVRDTLAGLATAAKSAYDPNERKLAKQALRKSRWRVVLHLEQRTCPHRLWPKPIDVAKLLQDFRKKRLKAVDAHPIICDQDTCHGLPWTVR